jgi:hypothetical protein
MTLTTLLIVAATVLFGYAVFESKGRSATAWAFFLMALAFCWPLVR